MSKAESNKRNNRIAKIIRSGLTDLNNKINKTAKKDKIKIKKLKGIIDGIKAILDFNKNRRQNKQSGQGLKILTPQQMLSRLPISLAQLKAGNNSEKLKK